MDILAIDRVVEPAALDRLLQGLVAAGTLALAVVTALLARTTRDDVRASRQIAEQTEQAVDAATQQAKAAWSQWALMQKTSEPPASC